MTRESYFITGFPCLLTIHHPPLPCEESRIVLGEIDCHDRSKDVAIASVTNS